MFSFITDKTPTLGKLWRMPQKGEKPIESYELKNIRSCLPAFTEQQICQAVDSLGLADQVWCWKRVDIEAEKDTRPRYPKYKPRKGQSTAMYWRPPNEKGEIQYAATEQDPLDRPLAPARVEYHALFLAVDAERLILHLDPLALDGWHDRMARQAAERKAANAAAGMERARAFNAEQRAGKEARELAAAEAKAASARLKLATQAAVVAAKREALEKFLADQARELKES